MKKAQQIGQVFIYVLTLVVISAVLVFGYNAIANFQDSSSKVSLLKLEKDMTKAVENLASDFGSVSQKSFAVGGFQQVCIVASFEPPAAIPSGVASQYRIIADSVESGAEENVFLIESGIVSESFALANVEVDALSKILCMPVQSGTLRLTLEGKGDRVLVSSAS